MSNYIRVDDCPDIAEQVVSALQTALGDRLRAVVLYGSRARGAYSPESDWDLFVIADDLPERPWERYQRIKRILPPGTRGIAALLATTTREFEARVSELYLDMALDGKILLDSSGYVAERLAQLRRTMDRAGLYRVHTDAGDAWRWHTEPTGAWSIEWEH